MRILLRSLAVVSALTLPLVAHADTFTGSVAITDTTHPGYLLSAATASFGPLVETSPYVFTEDLSLDFAAGDRSNADGDSVQATLSFTSPNHTSGDLTSTIDIDGSYNNPTGSIDWDPNQSSTITFTDGSTASFSVPDLTLNKCDDPQVCGTEDVTITLTPAHPPASTPEPSSLALLGTGILGAAGMIRRRFAL